MFNRQNFSSHAGLNLYWKIDCYDLTDDDLEAWRDMKTNNAGTGIIGVAIDPETGEEIDLQDHEHFYVCASCGQAVDRRDLGQVFHHEAFGHEPLKPDA